MGVPLKKKKKKVEFLYLNKKKMAVWKTVFRQWRVERHLILSFFLYAYFDTVTVNVIIM